jgi:hypothetical protein
MKSIVGRWVLGVCAVGLVACGSDVRKVDDDGGVVDDPSVVVARIGAAGGRIVTQDGAFELRIPAAALSGETEITVRTLPAASWPNETSGAPPIGGAVYELLPDGLTFEVPVQVVHRASAATLTGGTPGRYRAASHLSRSSAGTVERRPTSTAYRRSGAAAIVGEIQHFSAHWASLETEAGELSITLERDSGERSLWETFGVQTMTLTSDQAQDVELIAGAHTLEPLVVAPIVFEGWRFATDAAVLGETLLAAFEGEPLPAAYARSEPTGFSLAAGSPQSLDMPGPTFECAAPGQGLAWYELTVVGAALTVLVEDQVTCVDVTEPPVAHSTFATLDQPGVFAPFVVEPGLFAPEGLVEGREYLVVASQAAGGGLELLDVEDGARYPGDGAGKLFDVVALRDAAQAERFVLATDSGVSVVAFHLDPIEGSHFEVVHTPLADGYYASLDLRHSGGEGSPSAVLATRPGDLAFRILDDGFDPVGSVPSYLFPGEVYPGTTARMVFGASIDRFFAVFGGASAFEGAWEPIEGEPSPPATELSLDTPPSQLDFLRCADVPAGRVCALTSAADGRVHLFDVMDQGSAELYTYEAQGMPGDPAIAVHDEAGQLHVRVAVPTTAATYERYQVSLGAGPLDVTIHETVQIDECSDPRHARFGANGALYVTCVESANVVRVAEPFPSPD